MTFNWTISLPVVLTVLGSLITLGLGLIRLHRCVERRLTITETAMHERHEANLVQFRDVKDQIGALTAALLGRAS